MRVSIPCYCAIVTFALCFACTYDKGITPAVEFVDIGEYTLLQSSIDSIPYAGKSAVVFRDSAGNEVVLDIVEMPITMRNGEIIRHGNSSSGEETHFLFRYEQKEYVISSDSFGMKLTVHVFAAPYPRDPIPGFVADKFAVYATVPNSSAYFSVVFQAILDPRTWPEAFEYITELGEVEIFGRPFDNVLQIFSPLDTNAMYNYEVGVVSFSDVSGKQWRWERWE